MGLTFGDISRKYYGYLEKDKSMEYTKDALNTNINNLLKTGGTLYPKMQDTVKELSRNFKLCIVSNCEDGYIKSFLNNSNLRDYFIDYESHGKTNLSKI